MRIHCCVGVVAAAEGSVTEGARARVSGTRNADGRDGRNEDTQPRDATGICVRRDGGGSARHHGRAPFHREVRSDLCPCAASGRVCQSGRRCLCDGRSSRYDAGFLDVSAARARGFGRHRRDVCGRVRRGGVCRCYGHGFSFCRDCGDDEGAQGCGLRFAGVFRGGGTGCHGDRRESRVDGRMSRVRNRGCEDAVAAGRGCRMGNAKANGRRRRRRMRW